jgi:hypothetical protein
MHLVSFSRGKGAGLVEHHITFQALRYNVAEAFMDFINTTPRGTKLACPEIWVNGIGVVDKAMNKVREPEVIQAQGLRDAALLLDVASLSASPLPIVKDLLYKQYHCQKCDAAIFKSCFPYSDSIQLTLRYVRMLHDWPGLCSRLLCACVTLTPSSNELLLIDV